MQMGMLEKCQNWALHALLSAAQQNRLQPSPSAALSPLLAKGGENSNGETSRILLEGAQSTLD